jgi:hypothetical protein
MIVWPMVLAISDLLLSHRRWRDAGLAWLESFDNISLREIWRTAKAPRISAGREVIAALLFVELERRLGPPIPPKPQRGHIAPNPPHQRDADPDHRAAQAQQ